MLFEPVAVEATVGSEILVQLVAVQKELVLLIDDIRISYEGQYPAEVQLIDAADDAVLLIAQARSDGTISRDKPHIACRGSLAAIVRGDGSAHISLNGRMVHVAQAPPEYSSPDIDYLCKRKIVSVRKV